MKKSVTYSPENTVVPLHYMYVIGPLCWVLLLLPAEGLKDMISGFPPPHSVIFSSPDGQNLSCDATM